MITCFTLNLSIDRRYVVENARMGAANRVMECTATPGGKGLNVTHTVQELGEDVVAAGIAGGDHGNFIEHALDREGIHHHFTRVAGESRCCINIFDAATGTQTEYLEPGLQVTQDGYNAFLKDFDELSAKSDVITMSGSLPRGLPVDTYATLIQRVPSKRIFLDASGVALVNALPAHPFYIKPNESELAAVVGHPLQSNTEMKEVAQKLHDDGIACVAFTLGARGAMLCCGDGFFMATPPSIKTVNTVGCGDSFTGAFAVAVKRGFTPPEALRFAVGVSAACAMSSGTGELHIENVNDILPKVSLKSI
ncbi:MAG: 1-phosphofructokinase family hexose kinase [Victivallales bacterium]|nr:1-phosphofructokinase family hexose kinase [Victivallales bacterium]